MISFDPSVPSLKYLKQACTNPKLPRALDSLAKIDPSKSVDEIALRNLLTVSNWRQPIPRIRIIAEFGARRTIRANWEPFVDSDFRKLTATRELFRSPALDQALTHAQGGNDAACALLYAWVAAYQALVDHVRKEVRVVNASRIITFFELQIDIDESMPTET